MLEGGKRLKAKKEKLFPSCFRGGTKAGRNVYYREAGREPGEGWAMTLLSNNDHHHVEIRSGGDKVTWR
jgi:hypothetical protein